MPIKQYRRGSHPYHSYRSRVEIPQRKKVFTRRLILLVLCIVVTTISLSGYARYTSPLPVAKATVQYMPPIKNSRVDVAWSNAQQAFGTVNDGVLAEKPGQVPAPTASTAKLITALTVLQKRPLQRGEQGPKITMTQADVDSFNHYVSIGGSTVQVVAGEQLTEYQMLQGILLPSANNLADTLAVWAFGSMKEYQNAAQQYVRSIGAHNTTIGGDASGFSPDTVSTASDLTRIGIQAAKQPVLSEIMKQESVTLPIAGEKMNTNWLLDSDGVVGGKTGNTDQAHGVFVFISKQRIAGQEVTLVGATQGETTVQEAMKQSQNIIRQVSGKFSQAYYARKGQVVATYHTAWGSKVDAVAASDVFGVVWPAHVRAARINLHPITGSQQAGDKVGEIIASNHAVDIVLAQSVSEPAVTWRIFR